MADDNTPERTLERVILEVLVGLGMRLPAEHSAARMDERIELMKIVAKHIAIAVRKMSV